MRKSISKLRILSKYEYNQIITNFNNSFDDFSEIKCVHKMFEKAAKSYPNKIALIFDNERYTYSEIDMISSSIATYLVDNGIEENDIIPIISCRSQYFIFALIGILKAGAAYMPIDPKYPESRINSMIDDINPKLALIFNCNTRLNIKMIEIDSICYYETHNIPDYKNPENICYLIYTSGSTGVPKGTVIKHKNITNLLKWQNESTKLFECDIVAATTTFCFDVATQEILTALLYGKTCYLSRDDIKENIQQFSEYLVNSKSEVLFTTPSFFDIYVNSCENLQKSLKYLKSIVFAGEQLTINDKINEFENLNIYNQYGPCETHVCTSKLIDNIHDITIGKPIANTQIYILNKYGNPTPIGVTGELCIAGDGVGAGYLNRPELTAEKFVDNPFGEGKMYKTGDLAYWREDGNIVYVGRNDFQVKIRGLRIELGEIENAICQNENVSQAVVVVRKDETGRQLICAFYTEKNQVDLKEVKKNISDKLPKYMMPHIFTKLDVMPLTSSGKINRKALPDVDLHSGIDTTEYVKPVGELEKQLAAIMERVLNYSHIGLNDDFLNSAAIVLKQLNLFLRLTLTALCFHFRTYLIILL